MSGQHALFDEDKRTNEEQSGDHTLNINQKYADNYNVWRRNEDLQKLKDRYGDDAELSEGDDSEDDDSSEEEDEHAEQWTAEHEKHFLHTLSALKSGDSAVINKSELFPASTPALTNNRKPTNHGKEQQPAMYLRDAERLMVTDHNGELSESDGEDHMKKEPETYAKESQNIKDSFREIALQEEAEEEPLLKSRVKTKKERKREDDEYLQWLKTQDSDTTNQGTSAETMKPLEPLRSYWNDPELGEGEKFLRDYILERRFDAPNEHNDEQLPTYEQIVDSVADDNLQINRQAHFEHKYNFRFEEPDQEFIKSYPRTITDTARRTDDRRKEARDEVNQRKLKEKQQRRDEIGRMKAMKRDQINEKLVKLRKITGLDMKAFDADEFEKDFDPAEYDAKMQETFANMDAEGNDPCDEAVKPVFSDMSDDEDMADYDNWTAHGDAEGDAEKKEKGASKASKKATVEDSSNPDVASTSNAPLSKRQRKKQSALARALQKDKPLFDPKDKTFQEYYNEYYQLDCEDFVGDMACRFKYRTVAANDFGLSAQEVLSADDRELNGWVSLRKMSQYREDREEHYDQISYAKKAANTDKKRKLLPSAFTQAPEGEDNKEEEDGEKKKNRRRQKRKSTAVELESDAKDKDKESEATRNGPAKTDEGETPTEVKKAKVENEQKSTEKKETVSNGHKHNEPESKKKQRYQKPNRAETSDERLKAFGINPKKFRNKQKYGAAQNKE